MTNCCPVLWRYSSINYYSLHFLTLSRMTVTKLLYYVNIILFSFTHTHAICWIILTLLACPHLQKWSCFSYVSQIRYGRYNVFHVMKVWEFSTPHMLLRHSFTPHMLLRHRICYLDTNSTGGFRSQSLFVPNLNVRTKFQSIRPRNLCFVLYSPITTLHIYNIQTLVL